MLTLISIIVPVYNVELYLDKCIQSILAQSYPNFELLLIDDGSSDGSKEICDKYAKLDSRIRVFHRINGGVSSARNAGLEKAKGDWIAFIDADDWVFPNFLSDFVASLENNVDLYIQGYVDSNNDKFVKDNRYWVSSDLIVELDDVYLGQLYGFVWNKLFKSSIIRLYHLHFDEQITMLEDLLFIYDYLLHAKSVVNISKANYYYWRHTSSACFKEHSFNSWDLFLDKVCAIFSTYLTTHHEFASRKLEMFFKLSLDVLRSVYITNLEFDKRITYLKKIKKMAQKNELVKVCAMETFNNKIITFMLLYFPIIFADCLLWVGNKIISIRR